MPHGSASKNFTASAGMARADSLPFGAYQERTVVRGTLRLRALVTSAATSGMDFPRAFALMGSGWRLVNFGPDTFGVSVLDIVSILMSLIDTVVNGPIARIASIVSAAPRSCLARAVSAAASRSNLSARARSWFGVIVSGCFWSLTRKRYRRPSRPRQGKGRTMIDKSVKIVPGMRFSTGTQIRTVAKVVPGDPYPIVWDGDGDDADTEEWFRSNRTLVDQATPSDAAKLPERKVERRLAPGWRKWPHDWEPISRCSRCDAAPWSFANGARTACLACAESMGVYDGSGEPAEDAPSFARTTRDLPRITEKNMADLMNGTWREPCPCARMNLRHLSGDPVCYCTERPKEKAR